MPADPLLDLAALDLSNAQDIASHLSAAIAPGGAYRIDTAGWTGCDLAGVAVLLSALATARARGAHLSVGLPPDGPVAARMKALGIDPDRQLDMQDGHATGLRDAPN